MMSREMESALCVCVFGRVLRHNKPTILKCPVAGVKYCPTGAPPAKEVFSQTSQNYYAAKGDKKKASMLKSW